MSVFVHPQALCESSAIGHNTRIWAFAHILAGAEIGTDCNICDGVFIENDVRVGDRVTVKCGVQLWAGTTVGNDVFIGPNATFTNDRFPRSKEYPAVFETTLIGDGASIGANATILPGLKIGRRAMIGAGAVVVSDVPAHAIVAGNPARIIGYGDRETSVSPNLQQQDPTVSATAVQGVQLVSLTRATDLRGTLIAAEFTDDLPFTPKRIFVVLDVPSKDVRGAHAHRVCRQVLVCLAGSVRALVDDGTNRQEFVLDRPESGLYIAPMVWGTQYQYTSDAILLVFASHSYDPDDYIRDYDDFRQAVGVDGATEGSGT